MKQIPILLVALASAVGLATESGKKRPVGFDAQLTLSYIQELTTEAMQGRKSGETGGSRAVNYSSDKFRQWGLRPAGSNNSFLQKFAFRYANLEKGASLAIGTGKKSRAFLLAEEWEVLGNSGSGKFTGDLVFAGYGISAAKAGYDDYAGSDVRGKLLLLLAQVPEKLQKKLGSEAQLANRLKAAQTLGARGVLFPSPTPRMDEDTVKETYRQDFVVLSADMDLISYIFRDLPVDLKDLQEEMETSEKPKPYDTGVSITVNVSNTVDEARQAQNVLAMIPGNDRKLKSECVIIGAHLDHLGLAADGRTYHGADDNASGAAVVLEIARIMQNGKLRPRRTVIFALWAGEEDGMVGSKHYSEHPTCPLDKTVVNINLDMVGQGNGKLNVMGYYYGPAIWSLLKNRLSKEIMDNVKPARGGPGGSDHTSFLLQGVPAFMVISDGRHAKYHQPRDEVDLIKGEVLQQAGDFVWKSALILANEPGLAIPNQRRERYHWRYQTLVNFVESPAESLLSERKQGKDFDVDIQLVSNPPAASINVEQLASNTLKAMAKTAAILAGSNGFTLYKESQIIRSSSRAGKTTLLPGLPCARVWLEEPLWIEVLARQGISYLRIIDPAQLFSGTALSETGKEWLALWRRTPLLVILENFSETQIRSVLEQTSKPVLLIVNRLPAIQIRELLIKTDSVLGLQLEEKEKGGVYLQRLDQAKKELGTKSLAIVNRLSYWDDAGQRQIMDVIAAMLQAKYTATEMADLFSATFLRVLGEAREEERSKAPSSRPF